MKILKISLLTLGAVTAANAAANIGLRAMEATGSSVTSAAFKLAGGVMSLMEPAPITYMSMLAETQGVNRSDAAHAH